MRIGPYSKNDLTNLFKKKVKLFIKQCLKLKINFGNITF